MLLSNGSLTSKFDIPKELVSEIFLYCLDNVDELGCTVPGTLLAPLTLTWVCRSWRNTAISTRNLWTGLSLKYRPLRAADNMQLLLLWMARSDPLSFAVRFSCAADPTEEMFSSPGSVQELAVQFVNALLTCSSRWRALEITVPDVSVVAPIFDALARTSSGLQHLSVASLNLQFRSDPIHVDLSLIRELRSVSLVTPLVRPLTLMQTDLPLLTTLELHFCSSLQACLTWLDMCPNIRSLTVRLVGNEDHSETDERPLGGLSPLVRRLPQLSEVEFTCFTSFSHRGDPGLLLDLLELPALDDFELDMSSLYDAHQPWPHLVNLLGRSQANLGTLHLKGTPMTAEEVLQCIQYSHSLWFFSTDVMGDCILQALTPRPVQVKLTRSDEDAVNDNEGGHMYGEYSARYEYICPHLAGLDIHDLDDCSLQTIHNFIVGRCGEAVKSIAALVDETFSIDLPLGARTLNCCILPFDPLYRTVSHPSIREYFENNLYF